MSYSPREDYIPADVLAAEYDHRHAPAEQFERPSRAELAADGCPVCHGDGWIGEPCFKCGTRALL